MKRAGLIVVIVAFVALGRLASDTSRVTVHDRPVEVVQVAQANPEPLMQTSSNRGSQAPLSGVAVVDPMAPLTESASLLLLGSGLISVGVLVRRRIRVES